MQMVNHEQPPGCFLQHWFCINQLTKKKKVKNLQPPNHQAVLFQQNMCFFGGWGEPLEKTYFIEIIIPLHRWDQIFKGNPLAAHLVNLLGKTPILKAAFFGMFHSQLYRNTSKKLSLWRSSDPRISNFSSHLNFAEYRCSWLKKSEENQLK